MTRLRLAFVAGGLLTAGSIPAAQAPQGPPAYAIRDAPAALQPAIQRAQLVVVSLQNALLSELTRELTHGGTAAAIKSCHLDATDAAYRVARERGVAAGRTSHQLRNPLNAPRPWAAPIVARYAGRAARDVDGFVVDLGDRIGVLRPIAHQPMCGGCHGDEAKFDQKVRAELKERYPVDRATGFHDGDLRGWFWVEVPKP